MVKGRGGGPSAVEKQKREQLDARYSNPLSCLVLSVLFFSLRFFFKKKGDYVQCEGRKEEGMDIVHYYWWIRFYRVGFL